MNPTLALTWLLLLPLVASPVIYLAGRTSFRLGKSAAPARWLAALTLAATSVPLYFTGEAVLRAGTVSLSVGAISLRMDGVGLVLAGTVLALTFLVSLFSMPYMRREEGEEKHYALLVSMAGTMVGLGCANDLFNLWVWFEAMAVTSFLLVAFYREQRGALEAGVKYLVQSAVGSAFVLVGIALVFARTGTLELSQVAAAVAASVPLPLSLAAAGALFLIGFGVKAALVPLHTWLPDAHSQAPSGISAMLSGVVIEAGLVAMLRALGCAYALVGHSERRHIIGESDALIARKLRAALRNGLVPILCVGELLAERDGGKTEEVVRRQVGHGSIDTLDRHDRSGC